MSPLGLEAAVRRTAEEVERMTDASSRNCRTETQLWYELVACILGSNVRFEQARDATRTLKTAGLLSWRQHLCRASLWSVQIERVLRGRPRRKSVYRFPRLAATRICSTAENIYGAGRRIMDVLNSGCTPSEVREQLVNLACGVGPKQASLFLRNVGYTQDFAIIDRHVLKFIHLLGFCDEPLPPSSFKEYVFLEQVLRTYTSTWQVSFASVDTAIWVVMRTCRPGRVECVSLR